MLSLRYWYRASVFGPMNGLLSCLEYGTPLFVNEIHRGADAFDLIWFDM